MSQMRRSLSDLKYEGFRNVYTLSSSPQVDDAEIERQPLWNNLRREHGPFDIIGDVHGCFDELRELLKQLGYEIQMHGESEPHFRVQHPQGRKAVFLGDLVDRGPAIPNTLRLAMNMVSAGNALCIPGNHDIKL